MRCIQLREAMGPPTFEESHARVTRTCMRKARTTVRPRCNLSARLPGAATSQVIVPVIGYSPPTPTPYTSCTTERKIIVIHSLTCLNSYPIPSLHKHLQAQERHESFQSCLDDTRFSRTSTEEKGDGNENKRDVPAKLRT